MKRSFLILITLITSFMFTGSTLTIAPNLFEQFASTSSARKVEKEFKISSGKRLEINLKSGGALNISGWDKDVVTVKASIDGSDADDVDLQFEEFSGGLKIFSDYYEEHHSRSTDVELIIMVPRKFDLEFETMGGDISLKNISGEMSGRTMGGDLILSSLEGDLNLTTMGGEIDLQSSTVDGKVHTMGGKVTIKDVTGDIKGTSMGGNVSLKNVTRKNGESTKDKVVISSMGGNIDVDTAPAGADVSTMGGDININSAAKFVKAKTMGGDIIIDKVNGSVKATTMGGDVDVKVTGGSGDNKDVELSSMGGDIYLTVPADLAMTIEIKLAVTKHHSLDDFEIKSDFDLKREKTDKWDSDGGKTPRKYIYGKGKTGDGKNRIKIETINGNVHLKKG